jgi:hypothetical protein
MHSGFCRQGFGKEHDLHMDFESTRLSNYKRREKQAVATCWTGSAQMFGCACAMNFIANELNLDAFQI